MFNLSVVGFNKQHFLLLQSVLGWWTTANRRVNIKIAVPGCHHSRVNAFFLLISRARLHSAAIGTAHKWIISNFPVAFGLLWIMIVVTLCGHCDHVTFGVMSTGFFKNHIVIFIDIFVNGICLIFIHHCNVAQFNYFTITRCLILHRFHIRQSDCRIKTILLNDWLIDLVPVPISKISLHLP